MMKKEHLKKIAKATIIVIAIVFAYLYLLNGRYAEISGGSHFDKWKGKMVYTEWED